MRWISNNDPPLYVWEGDEWYNQKNRKVYFADIEKCIWHQGPVMSMKVGAEEDFIINFPEKTKIKINGKWESCKKQKTPYSV